MRDEGLTTPPNLNPAEAAVLYVLKRIQVDVDLRFHMLDTEAFARLCAAESQRIGKSPEQVRDQFAVLAPHCRHDKPRIQTLRQAIQETMSVLERNENGHQWIRDLINTLELFL